MTKQPKQSPKASTSSTDYTDPSFSDAEMARIIRNACKIKHAPYGGARSYQLLPEERG